MRREPGIFLLLIFLLFFQEAFSQNGRTSGTIRVKKPADATPRIAGKSEGKITAGELCHPDGIYVTEEGVKIISFEISFFSSREITQIVEGNRMNDRICMEVQKMKKDGLIHIYNILAQDGSGAKFTLNPMRFTADNPELTENEKVLYVTGFYQQKLTHIPVNKTYIKIGQMSGYNSGPAWLIKSPGEPVVLNQVYDNNYAREGIAHGEYTIIGKDSIVINFSEEYSICDYRGKLIEGRLELQVVGHDGQIYTDRERFIILPFSRINRE